MAIATRIARRTAVTTLALTLLLAPASPATAASDLERQQHTLVNEVRSSKGRKPLKLHAKLSRIARKHSRRMANRGELYHNAALAKQVAGMRWRILAENVGTATDAGDSYAALDLVHETFMDSPPHRKNILLKKTRKMGVGVVEAGGRLWVTLVFLG